MKLQGNIQNKVKFGLSNTSVFNAIKAQPQQQQPALPALNILQTMPSADQKNMFAPFLYKMQPTIPAAPIQKTSTTQTPFVWKNDLRSLFANNKAVVYAMVVRTFNAKDTNGDDYVKPSEGETTGTFINAIDRLDELKEMGINTLHVLPINPPGQKEKFGKEGSVYAPASFDTIDQALDDKTNPMNVKDEAKKFIEEAHKRGIRVMIDLPSCSSVDFYEAHPEMMAKDALGNPKVPHDWKDIRALQPWKDEDKQELNQPVYNEFKKFVDLCLEIGADGIRADVARGKPAGFWKSLTDYARSKDPEFSFLAESYVYEDASPLPNIPADRPKDLLHAGFDSYYGQYHIFNEWKTDNEFHNYVVENLNMSQEMPEKKSLIASFATHDDVSPMNNGGAAYCNLTTGLQSTIPMANPYFISGFESGDEYVYKFEKLDDKDFEISKDRKKLDLFNNSRKPGGNHPEIGDFMKKMLGPNGIRSQYEDILTKGSYIPLKTDNKNNQIIAFARHLNGKTILVVANKDVNARETGKINIPTLLSTQVLKDVAPSYGEQSKFTVQNGGIQVDLGPARFHMFEIDTKEIEKVEKSYKQK